VLERYLEIAAQIDREFDRNRRLHGDRIHCCAGCYECCHQLFQITEIEAEDVSRGVRRMDPAARERLLERARAYQKARSTLVTLTGEPEAWGKLPPPGTRLLCPALEDGVCVLYDHRPLICRKFGMPIYNPDRRQLYACELNFRDGEEIHDPQLVQIQTGLHEAWKQLQADYNAAGGWRDPEPLTVARAILAVS
jgi:Fe-S-cluster containining protein